MGLELADSPAQRRFADQDHRFEARLFNRPHKALRRRRWRSAVGRQSDRLNACGRQRLSKAWSDERDCVRPPRCCRTVGNGRREEIRAFAGAPKGQEKGNPHRPVLESAPEARPRRRERPSGSPPERLSATRWFVN